MAEHARNAAALAKKARALAPDDDEAERAEHDLFSADFSAHADGDRRGLGRIGGRPSEGSW